jgi:hypothetical protein
MLSKALEIDICFYRGPLSGNVVERFPRAFERRDKFFYLGEFYKEFERYVKTWRGSFTGTFERKRGCISGFLFRGPRGH